MAAALGVALVVDALALTAFSSLLLVSAGRLSSRLPEYLSRLQAAEAHLSETLRANGIDAGWNEVLDPVSVFGTIASLAGDVVFVLLDLGLALVIAGFLLFQFARMSSDGSDGVGLGAERVRRAVREMYRYITVRTLTSIATGALIGGWLWAIGGELPTLFGLLAFLLNFIPAVGTILALALALVVALLQHGVEHALLVLLGYAVVNVVIGSVVEPKLMGRALGLWPLVVLLSVVFWGWLLGLVGAVLSALLTQVVKVALLSSPDLRWIGLAMGPRPRSTSGLAEADLLEEAMPPSRR
jgi:predicted PurR-regulated permease PerM